MVPVTLRLIVTGSLMLGVMSPGCDRRQGTTTPPAQSAGQPAPAGAAPATAPANTPTATGAQVRALWLDGRKEAAADLLVGTDWSKQPSGAAAAISALTEKDFAALPEAQRQAKRDEIMKSAAVVRELSRFVIERGKAHAAQGAADEAVREMEGLDRFGAAISGALDLAQLTRQVGVAVRRAALTELASLHQAAGNQEKQAAARRRLDDVKSAN